ncbi:GNAT family N-acetyltransferase [Paenibacillus hemerocallicola]|nr:GNAT family N-acetyltransferase [Paenibacillus hemerocallicola]
MERIVYRKVGPADKPVLLELHCEINYACDTSWARELPYGEYRAKWMSTSQPGQYYDSLIRSMDDPRTMAQLAETEDGRTVGYLWVEYVDVPDYGLTIAEIRDFVICGDFRGQGRGLGLLAHIEEAAKRNGADLLRSETGSDNIASCSLHRKHGFETYRVAFEKRLADMD